MHRSFSVEVSSPLKNNKIAKNEVKPHLFCSAPVRKLSELWTEVRESHNPFVLFSFI